MCEIQLQTCCGCSVCNSGRWEVAAAWWRPCRQQNHNGLGRGQELVFCHHTAHQHCKSSSWSVIITDTLHASLSQCTRVSRKGMLYTLLATSLYNSCPAPKIEYSNSTHCFIGGGKNRIMHVEWKAACFQINGDYIYVHIICIILSHGLSILDFIMLVFSVRTTPIACLSDCWCSSFICVHFPHLIVLFLVRVQIVKPATASVWYWAMSILDINK